MTKADVFTNTFARDIFLQKYSMDQQETWSDTCSRVVEAVCGQLMSPSEKQELHQYMYDRKFIPGGRYLYASGRPFHQVNNCVLFRAEDSREGWSDIMHKSSMSLMTGAGVGIDYSAVRPEGSIIKKTGGLATGPLALMRMVNETGRYIMQGGQRRSAIWAGLNWKHQDIPEFLNMKNVSEDVRRLKAQDFTFPVQMELTNVSVIYDTEFFVAIEDEKHPFHELAKGVYYENCRKAFSTAEPGMSFNYLKDRESLRNACVSGDTEILTDDGYRRIDSVVDREVSIWNGFEWSTVTPKVTGKNEKMLLVTLSDGRTLNCTYGHDFHTATNYFGGTAIVKAQDLQSGMKLIKHKFPIIEHGEDYEFAYSQGFISADGQDGYNFAWVYEPKYMCISRLNGHALKVYKNRRQFRFHHKPLFKSFVPFTWNLKSKLDWLAGLIDGDGTELKEGGMQLASVDRTFLIQVQALLSTLGVQCKIGLMNKAGMRAMPDGYGGSKDYLCQDSYRICVGAVQIQELKALGLKCERMSFDKTPQRDASQFVTVVDVSENGTEGTVYCFNEPKRHLGVFNGVLTGQCTEVTSEDDSDKCNLGTVWMNRCKDRKEFARVIRLSTKFLICGGLYSDVPTELIREIGLKNNRIGLGLGGMHEWLMVRSMAYQATPEMHKWLNVYEQESDSAAFIYAKELGVSTPKGVRAIAPTGTIGILAETTTGIEPLFCKAYKRRYFKDGQWLSQYVVDGAVKRLISQGVKVEDIKDSYDLDFKTRVKFQADVQNYVDMSISSTCNMPAWGSAENNESTLKKHADILLKYAKRLRGFTCYPDGCRDGQPLTRVDLEEALANEGTVFVENEVQCINGVCGV